MTGKRMGRIFFTLNQLSAHRWLVVASLFVLAAGIRLGWVVYRFSPEQSAELMYPDEHAYWHVARSLAAGEGMEDDLGFHATYMPGYPLFLAIWTSLSHPLFWARVGQTLIGACAAPLTYWLTTITCLNKTDHTANRLQLTHIAPLAAGLAVAFDPFFLYFSSLLLTETLFITTLLAAWVGLMTLVTRRTNHHWLMTALLSLAMLACIYLRPSSLLVIAAGLGLLAVIRHRQPKAWLSVALVSIVLFLGLLPWAYRNHRTIGQWRWLTTRGGISLYDGVQQGATGASDLAHTKTMPAVKGMSETQWDAYFKQQAYEAIRNNPKRIVKLAGAKFLRIWSLTPNVETYRTGPMAWISAFWMLLILTTAIIGWWYVRHDIVSWLILLTPALVFTGLHMIFVGSVRYRLPAMPMLMVLSGIGLSRIIVRCLNGSRVGSSQARGDQLE